MILFPCYERQTAEKWEFSIALLGHRLRLNRVPVGNTVNCDLKLSLRGQTRVEAEAFLRLKLVVGY